jgi:tetratricopeptide (TPR) repeat protein
MFLHARVASGCSIHSAVAIRILAIGIDSIMKRLTSSVLLIGGFVLLLAGCASDPYLEGARLDLRNQDYDRALENVERALADNPDNPEALDLKGRILQEQAANTTNLDERGRLINEMVAAYNRAIQANPATAALVEQRLVMAWIDEVQDGVEAFNTAQDAPGYQTAARRFEFATRIQPDSSGAYINQAFALMNANMEAEAIGPLRRAIELGEDSSDMYTRLAALYQMTDRPREAVGVLRDARDRHPGDQDIQSQLLNAFIAADMVGEAMQEYSALVQQDPTNQYYRYNYGSLLLEAEQYEEAIAQLREAVRINPTYPSAQFNLGAAYINQAVDAGERINEMDDQLREQRGTLSQDEIRRRENEIDRMVENRREFFRQAIEPLERALDYSSGARFEVSGDFGIGFTGELSGRSVRDGSNLSRSVQGFTPEDYHIGEGTVSGTFRKRGAEGVLQVSLIVGNDEIATQTTEDPEGTISISENVGPVGFQGQTVSSICQALFSAYIQVGEQDKAEPLQDCAGYGDVD